MFPAMQIFALQAKPSESAHAVLSQNFPLFWFGKVWKFISFRTWVFIRQKV